MQPAFDRDALDRLISLGRKHGHLTTGDLRTYLPVEAMSAEDIALVVVEVEEMGVPVELEDSLLSPNANPRPIERKTAEIIPFPSRDARTHKRKVRVSQLQGAVAPQAAGTETKPVPTRSAHWAVAASGLVVIAVIGLIIWF